MYACGGWAGSTLATGPNLRGAGRRDGRGTTSMFCEAAPELLLELVVKVVYWRAAVEASRSYFTRIAARQEERMDKNKLDNFCELI